MFSIDFQEWRTRPPDTRQAIFILRSGGDYLRPIAIEVPTLRLEWLVAQNTDSEQGIASAETVVLEWSVQRIEDGILSGELVFEEPDEVFHVIEATEDDVSVMGESLRKKQCSYRVEDGRELYCAAAQGNDDTAVGSIGIRTIAPTSVPVCLACALPSTSLLCSHLSHPRVNGFVTFGGWERSLAMAFCGMGDPNVGNPGDCRPGGHSCWVRITDTRSEHSVDSPGPLDLPEAFDFFDSVWRLEFGRHSILKLITAREVAGIALGCANRAEFEERIGDLADLINNLDVKARDLPDGLDPAETVGSLNRLQAALGARLSPEDAALIERPLLILRRIATIRNGFSHSGAAKKLPNAFADIGLSYPPRDWGAAWDQIRVSVIGALRDLRELVRSIEPSSDE